MEKTKKIFTLCIVHQHPRVLLGMKKRGFGEGDKIFEHSISEAEIL